ncbi:hypothetical protein MMC28_001874 [Mycoblastus sanguinarius]|nr:hypothetical protein [Mycoblastus sanguinarius]
MQVLPIIIILSLLGFFILLTLTLFLWQYLRTRRRHEKRKSNSSNSRPTRQLTVRSGKVIPVSDAHETASTRGPMSLDLISPVSTHVVEKESEDRRDSQLSKASSSTKHPSEAIDLEAQYRGAEPHHRREQMVEAHPHTLSAAKSERTTSLTVPRPSLVTIESRRPSTIKSQSRSTSTGQEIADSLQKAYTGPSVLGGETHELPASPVLREMAYSSDSRRTSDRRPSAVTLDSPTTSSRAVSESIQRPAPLFSPVDYGPRVVRFAAMEDLNRRSFLSTTESTSSSIASEPSSPVVKAPPPSMVTLPPYSQSPSPLSRELGTGATTSTDQLRSIATPIDTEAPRVGETSFLGSATLSEENPNKLKRGVSVMSNRSMLTIASSDISSNWTIGNAHVVNIYPSVAQERAMPSYARKLRSKYGRYPKGRRDKALPVIPKSPLSQRASILE